MTSLGTIEEVDLRKAWEHEATDFTNWLAEEENLNLLSEEIGIDLNLLETEANVGHFNVDIFAEDAIDERKVIIENQLESTDHDHLGKIITYASGLDAEIMLWIVREGREEHRRAVDWLNNHTDEDLNFFLVKVELWKIEDSPMAPKFKMVSKPNDWAKEVKQSARETQLTDTKIKQREFWQDYKEYAEDQVSYSLQKPRPQHWYNVSVGTSGVKMALTINTREDVIGCEFYIRDNDDLFNFLADRKGEIEKSIGQELTWMALPEKQASRIKIEKHGILDKEDEWSEYFDWLIETSQDFYEVFREELSNYEQ